MLELPLASLERAELKQLSSRRKTAQALALRARIILECARGLENQEVAADLAISKNTVGKWRRRFVERRMEGLHDEPRSGAPRSIGDDGIEAVIVRTLESLPDNATHWSSRGMAKASGISVSSVQRIWRAFGLQPHRIETFKLSTDPDFVAKVRDVVGLYVAPPDRAVVLCVDEKSQIQALDRSQPMLPMRPGQIARRSSSRVTTSPGCSRSITNSRNGCCCSGIFVLWLRNSPARRSTENGPKRITATTAP